MNAYYEVITRFQTDDSNYMTLQNSGDSEKHVILRGWEMRRTKAILRAMKTALYDTDNGGHMSLYN